MARNTFFPQKVTPGPVEKEDRNLPGVCVIEDRMGSGEEPSWQRNRLCENHEVGKSRMSEELKNIIAGAQ